jgi:tetraacyldisaccharide 4'-kinase
MHEPAFWWRPPGVIANLLTPLAALYGTIAAARLRRLGRRCGIPVICIGNFTLGGTGKTPTALAVGAMLKAAGARPYFLSRGYGGSLAGPVLVDPVRHSAAEVGDEPLLLARAAPTIVARDRVAGAAAARADGATVVVMDDGFQNPSLAKDLSIVVVDGLRGIGNGRVFPAGPLRAPLEAQLPRADALVVVGHDEGARQTAEVARARRIPVFAGRLDADTDDLAALAGRPVLAFAGIGDPEKFFGTLAAAGVDVRVRRAAPDHYHYTADDAAVLLAQARDEALIPVTTEKDMARLSGRTDTAELANATRTLRVSLRIDDRDGFAELVRKAAARSLSG